MKILLIQTSFLGDTILSTPVIAGIKQEYPDSELWMMTTPLSSSLVERDPMIAGVIPFDKRNQYKGMKGLLAFSKMIREHRFDKVYSLHKSIRTSLLVFLSGIKNSVCFDVAKGSFLYREKMERLKKEHDVLRNLSILSPTPLKDYNTDMRLFAPDAGELGESAKEAINGTEPYAVLVPGSAWATKMWHTEGFSGVADSLREKGIKIILMGSDEDTECCDTIAKDKPGIYNLAGRTTISEALYIMKHATLAVCNDSMSLHMASAFRIPTVVIFCSTIPEFGYGPWNNEKSVVIEKKLSCRPCGSHGKKKCPEGTNACMEGISHNEVIRAIESLDLI